MGSAHWGPRWAPVRERRSRRSRRVLVERIRRNEKMRLLRSRVRWPGEAQVVDTVAMLLFLLLLLQPPPSSLHLAERAPEVVALSGKQEKQVGQSISAEAAKDKTVTEQCQKQRSCHHHQQQQRKGGDLPAAHLSVDGENSGRTLVMKRETFDKSATTTTSPTDQLLQHCQAAKTSKRESKKGCKYLRGQWSSGCTADGLRVRVDKLISRLEDTQERDRHDRKDKRQANSSSSTCQLERRVTKDCKRACHYVKSAWSECQNGFKTRNLTLDTSSWSSASQSSTSTSTSTSSSPPPPPSSLASGDRSLSSTSGCARDKQVRRPCKARELAKQAANKSPAASLRAKVAQRRRPKLSTTTATSTFATSSTSSSSNKQQHQQYIKQTVRPPDANIQSDATQATSAAAAAGRRREEPVKTARPTRNKLPQQ